MSVRQITIALSLAGMNQRAYRNIRLSVIFLDTPRPLTPSRSTPEGREWLVAVSFLFLIFYVIVPCSPHHH